MPSQCYLPRSSQSTAIGAIFVTRGGVCRFIPDHLLAEAELSERSRLLRLTYTCCTVEVAGQALDALFEDAIVGRLGTIMESPSIAMQLDQLWVSSILAIVPAVADSSLDRR